MANIITVKADKTREINFTTPTTVVITNVGSRKRMVSISGTSQQFPIEPGDKVKLTCASSTELVGYVSQDDDDLVIEREDPTASSNS